MTRDKTNTTSEDFKRLSLSKVFIALWKKTKSFIPNDEPTDILIKRVKEIEKNNLHKQEIFIVFSVTDFKPLYISEVTFEKTGYTPQELINFNTSVFFRIVRLRDIRFPFKAAAWADDFQDLRREKKITNGYRSDYYFGLRFRKKSGEEIITSVRLKILMGDNDEIPETTVIVISDITHLFRGNFFCVRYTVKDPGTGRRLSRFYRSTGGSKVMKDIVTEREKEILLKSKAGLNNKEIAEALFISTATVEKHKKNMLNRTGARDITSLIHLCVMCELF